MIGAAGSMVKINKEDKMKREQCITIRPGPISHKVIFRIGARTIIQRVPADNPVETVQLWAERAYKRLRGIR